MMPKGKRLNVTFVLYKAKDGWRWHAHSANGRLIAESGEGYKRKAGCLAGLRSMIDHVISNRYHIKE